MLRDDDARYLLDYLPGPENRAKTDVGGANRALIGRGGDPGEVFLPSGHYDRRGRSVILVLWGCRASRLCKRGRCTEQQQSD